NLELSAEVIQLAAVNLPVFGGELGLRLPRVDSHDRLLDFMLIEVPEPHSVREHVELWLEAARSLGRKRRAGDAMDTDMGPADLPAGIGYLTLPGVHRYQARAAVIETPEPVDVTLDGELRSRTPAHIQVAPEPVHILLPPEAATAASAKPRRVQAEGLGEAGEETGAHASSPHPGARGRAVGGEAATATGHARGWRVVTTRFHHRSAPPSPMMPLPASSSTPPDSPSRSTPSNSKPCAIWPKGALCWSPRRQVRAKPSWRNLPSGRRGKRDCARSTPRHSRRSPTRSTATSALATVPAR